MKRPSETVTATAASILGAVLIILGFISPGFTVPPQVQGAIILLVGWIAAGVTWVVARRQRNGAVGSAPDGHVE